MQSATVDNADHMSSSMSSSFTSPKSSPTPVEDLGAHAQRSPALSFANASAPGAAPGVPGGEPTNGHTPARSPTGTRPRANAAGVNAGGVHSANVHARPRPAPAAPGGAANVTPKPPVREPLQQQHFDVAASDENHFGGGGSAQKLTRSDTAPLTGREVPSGTASAARHQQSSPQQPPRPRQQVQAGLWAEQLAHRCFMCPTCVKVVSDPVLLVGERKMVCRRCVPLPRPTSGVAELPLSLLEAIKEIFTVGDVKPVAAGATATDVDRPPVVSLGSRCDSGDSAAANATGAHQRGGNNSSSTGTQRESAVESTDDVASNGRAARAAGAHSGNPSPASASEKSAEARPGARTGGRPTGPTSRQYKVEADHKYEAAEYTAALELYTKAINLQPQDGLTQLRFLYGNRSAAHFMAQRYSECVADCMEVVKLEPNNVKMISRAARSAATMGDLKRAVSILEATPPKSLSEAMASELAKYRTGLDLFQKAESGFGTPEGDERYRMLVAQFSDTVPFRIRYAESLMQQKQYVKAAEVLEVISSSARPPKLCKLLGQCLYHSGFERFEAARKAVRDAAQIDDECAELLRLIERVDEGKQKGNANFTEKKFAAAVEHYSAAIAAAEDNEQILRILYCNRAAANKELGRFREGVDDCTKAITLDKDFFKAYARRARCHQNLGDYFAAVQDFRRAVEFEPSDRELARELRQAENNLQKEAEREKDYYYQLGLTTTATDREIKMKYRELSLRWHPDKCVNLDPVEKERAEHKFKVIGESYATLIDPAKRREYDLRMNRSNFRPRSDGFSGFSSTYSTFNAQENFRGRTRGTGGFW